MKGAYVLTSENRNQPTLLKGKINFDQILRERLHDKYIHKHVFVNILQKIRGIN